MKPAVIVIPCYQNTLNSTEIILLQQCTRVLGKFDIIFLSPIHMRKQEFQLVRCQKWQSAYLESTNKILK